MNTLILLSGLVYVGVIVGIILLLIVYVISVYNGLVTAKNKCEEAFSAMDVQMVKRYDLIPNIVATVKGYAKHEQETITGVVEARNKAISATTPESKIAAEEELSGVLSKLMVLVENYPDLKASTGFEDLQKQLAQIETEIASARKYYNAVVVIFNNKVETVPSNIVASIFNFKKRPLFEVTSEEQRQNVKVEF